MKVSLYLLTFIFILNFTTLKSQNKYPEQYKVNNTSYNAGSDYSISMHPEGNYVIAWRSSSHDASQSNRFRSAIWARQYNKNGQASHEDFQLPRYWIYGESFNGKPSIAMSKEDEFTVFWETYFYAGGSNNSTRKIVRKQNYNATSFDAPKYFPKAYESRFQFVEDIDWHTPGPFSYSPYIAISPFKDKHSYNYTYAWIKNTADNLSNIFVKYSFGIDHGDFGSSKSETINITENNPGHYRNPKILKYGGLNTLKFVIVYEKLNNNKWEVYSQRFEYNHENSEFDRKDLHLVTPQNIEGSKIGMAIKQTGEYAISWSEKDTESASVVYTEITDADDNNSPAIKLHNANGLQNINPSIAVNDKGNFLCAWEQLTLLDAPQDEYANNPKISNIFIREVNVFGKKLEGKKRIAFSSYYYDEFEGINSSKPNINADVNGGIVISWMHNSDIYAKHINTKSHASPNNIILTKTTLKENIHSEEVIAQLLTDGENIYDNYQYAIVDDATTDYQLFRIEGNKLKTKEGVLIDYETKKKYSLKIKSFSPNGNEITKEIEFSVNNINEAPTNISIENNSIAENTKDRTVSIITGTDTDSDRLVYALVTGEGDTDNNQFIVEGNSLKLAENIALNYQAKKEYKIRLAVSDAPYSASYTFSSGFLGGRDKIEAEGKYFYYEKEFTIHITEKVAAKTINLSNNEIDENSEDKTIGELTIDVANNGEYSFDFEDEKDKLSFEIEGTTLKFKDNINIDFETKESYQINIALKENNVNILEKLFTININDINEAPTEIELSNNRLNEDTDELYIGNLSIDDPEKAVFMYSLVDGDGSDDNDKFEIDGSSLKIKNDTKLNFEQKSEYHVRIQAQENGVKSIEKEFVIFIQDVNEIPVIELIADILIESSDDWQYQIEAIDEDKPNQELSYSLENAPNGMQINQATGLISFKPNSDLNGDYNITVRTVDNNGGEAFTNFNIQINLPEGTATSIEKVGVSDNLRIYPIPTVDNLNIDLSDSYIGELEISIYNILGKKIESFKYHKSNRKISLQISVNHIKKGIFMIKIKMGKDIIVKKFQKL
ncbi:MAG: T9SS type A sorting domain-containing protein [Marinifilaceae bacterium]|jgi:hypothetical protein|nr:T9SS type A sorting domain-containing protein [Marinifilaceae bacterium]